MAIDKGDQVSPYEHPIATPAETAAQAAERAAARPPGPEGMREFMAEHPLTESPLERAAREAVTQPAPAAGAEPGTELALMSTAELEAIVGTRTVPVREWAESLVTDTDFPDDDPDEMALGILAGILLAQSSEEALAVTNLQRAKELCGNMPGGHSPLLEITAAMPFKSTYEQGAPCYAMVSATVVSTGEKFKFTTGARAVQAVIIAHLVHGWMPFRCLITMRATPTQRGYYPLNLEAGG